MSPPNIVLFMCDQLRCDALSCYGNAVCRTPNLDRLAAEGVRFDAAYATSPVSSPSRASLLTGLYPHNHGVMINTHIAPAWSRGLSPEAQTFSALLKRAGYALDYVGKWHVHQDLGPTEFGFDRHLTPEANHWDALPGSEEKIAFPGGSQLAFATHRLPREQCEVWRYAEAGAGLLRERSAAHLSEGRAEGAAGGPRRSACQKADGQGAASGQAFFLRIDTNHPHFPTIVPEPYASMYDPASIPPWPNFDETFAGKPASHLRKHRDWHLEDKGWDWWSRVVASYYGDVSYIDDCVGRVVDELRGAGREDETVFVFTSDHGDATGSHRHFEKGGTMYEEVFRVPLLVKTPAGWPKGLVVKDFVRLLDLMPTFVELGGASLQSPVDGRSLVPLLRGESAPGWPDSVYCEHHGEVWGYQSQRMVRTRRWKYVYNAHDLDELYDLESDPAEMKNMIADPSCARVLTEMQARFLGWNDATNDMFRWFWVRWNLPEPVRPDEVSPERLPHTCEGR